MKDVLEKEITREAVTVTLAGESYPIGFPIFAVTLYKQETAKLNCRRQKQAEEAGRRRLTVDEERALRHRYREITQQLELNDFEQFMILREEAVAIRHRLDEESGSGDSLFQVVNWWKIREDDPDRVLLALWAALHQEQGEAWKAPLTLSQLGKIVDFSNVIPILRAIAEALAAYMPRAREKDSDPKNAQRPEEIPAETILAE